MIFLRKLFLVLFFFVIGLHSILFAAESGQVINVNQNYQVAFTDLDNKSLKQGDIVKVFVNDDDFIYMQVMESSSILSKLGISQKENFKTHITDIRRIAVGNKVALLSEVVEAKYSKLDNAVEPKNNIEAAFSAEQIKELMAQLKEANEEIRHLRKVNQFLKSQINDAGPNTEVKKTGDNQTQVKSENSAETRSQLKDRLEKMQRLLNHD
ncbi:MAG: hypothetical protein HQL12_09195 [Candidatus Omnitrophica bacterium]|nr:hypothetical protein [Candidatus Omnitrophota bacterium]